MYNLDTLYTHVSYVERTLKTMGPTKLGGVGGSGENNRKSVSASKDL